jgi:hypothetical protein
MLAKGTEDLGKICIVCTTQVKTEDRFVCVATATGAAIIHRDCHDTWVASKNKKESNFR